MRRLFAAILDFLVSWWRVDRIRVSPREGYLLRLEAGSIVYVGGKPFEVTCRSVFGAYPGQAVQYQCRGTEEDAELRIDSTKSDHVTWIVQGQQRELPLDELDVWRISSSRPGSEHGQ